MPDTNSSTEPTNNEMKIELLVNMIPKFKGNKANFNEFLDNCDLAQSLATSALKPTLLTFIQSKILGSARAHIRNRELQTWKVLRDHLVELYSDKRSQSQWQLELNLCSQNYNEGVTSYSHRVENCLIKLTNSLDDTLTATERQPNVKLLRAQALNIFVMGLNKDLNLIVKSQKHTTLEEAITLAQAEEKELQTRKAVDKIKTPYFKRPTLNPTHFEKTKPNTFVSRPNTTRLGSRPVSPWKPSFASFRNYLPSTPNPTLPYLLPKCRSKNM